MSRAIPGRREPSTRRLFAVYVAASLVPVVALGVLLSLAIQRQADRAGLRQGANEAQLVARSSIAPLLGGHDLDMGLTHDEKAALQRSVRLIIHNRQVLRLRLRDLAGRVVFADDGSGLGTVDDEALEAAHGETVTALTWLNADEGDTGRRGPRVVEAYVPLVAAQSNQRIGVLEAYLPYAPIQANVATGKRMMTGTLLAGLLLLWLAMLGVSLSVTRVLRRQSRDNAFLARHDALTGLPNRSRFIEQAHTAIPRASAARQVALALIDLDRFKEINDTLGHDNGDDLLVALGERLASRLRDGDLVARLGGDEFGVILCGVRGVDEATELLTGLRSALAEPVSLDDLPLTVEASIGFVLAPDDGSAADLLLARADLAMYAAKTGHRGVLHYSDDHDRYDAATLTLVAELGSAIDNDELVLHYQPKADLRDGVVRAVEALVRWQHPVKGLLYPDAFLPGAEQTELVEPLTRWVLARALRDVDHLDPGRELSVAVNISARSLTRTDFADDVVAIVGASGVDPHRIVLEMTETALLVDPERAARTLTALAAHGMRISIDDFGAGQTSLGYLARLPVSELKIDKAFVLAMTDDPRNAAIVRSVIELGHSLGFTVTAEGVETTDALADLAAANCDLVQGYLLARPMPLDQLRDALPGLTGVVLPAPRRPLDAPASLIAGSRLNPGG